MILIYVFELRVKPKRKYVQFHKIEMRFYLNLVRQRSSGRINKPETLADFETWFPRKKHKRHTEENITDVVDQIDDYHAGNNLEQPDDPDPVQKDVDADPHTIDQREYSESNAFVTQHEDGSYFVSIGNMRPGDAMLINIDNSGIASSSVVSNVANSNADDTHEVNNHVDIPFCDSSQTRCRKRVRDSRKWKRNVNKRLRQEGKAYRRQNGGVVTSKHPCLEVSLCREKCRRKCSVKIQDSQREEIFNSYYNLETEDIKNMYLFKCISPVKPRTLRLDAQKHHQNSFRFSVSVDGDKMYVCKKALSSLHQISMSKIDVVAKQRSQGLCAPKPSCQGKHSNRPAKLSPERFTEVVEHISKFPAEPSHYSRSHNTGRMYLSSTLSINKMYELYKESCEEGGSVGLPVSSSAYRNVFVTKFNLGFGNPRSDTCGICDVGIDAAHKISAQLAFDTQKTDRQMAKNKLNTVFCTFDLQKTLPLPKLSTNVAFYLRQAWLYNLGVHFISNVKDHPYFFIWTEDQGRRGCEEVSSSLLAFMDAANISKEDHMIFWSDSCAGQNKNFFVLCLWQYLVGAQKVRLIDHKFPEPGHSYLDSDRDFAHIEKSVRLTQNIYSVDEYQNIMLKSQKKNSPVVTRMADKFYNIKNLPALLHLKNNPKTVDGQKVQFRDKVKWVRIDRFGFYKYRESYDETEPWKTVKLLKPHIDGMPDITLTFRPTRKCMLKEAKIKDLQKQLAFIPTIYHCFYDSIISASGSSVGNNDDDCSDIEIQSNEMSNERFQNTDKQLPATQGNMVKGDTRPRRPSVKKSRERAGSAICDIARATRKRVDAERGFASASSKKLNGISESIGYELPEHEEPDSPLRNVRQQLMKSDINVVSQASSRCKRLRSQSKGSECTTKKVKYY